MKLDKMFLAVCFLLLLVPVVEKFDVLPKINLAGATHAAEKPVFSLSSYFQGTYQKSYEEYYNASLGLKPYMVKIFNQLKYDLFYKSAVKTIEVGQDETLFQVPYIDAYFIDSNLPLAEIEDLAIKVNFIKSRMEQEGKSFVFSIAPSKAALYPEKLPKKYRKLDKSNNRVYDLFTTVFDNHNVSYIDGPEILRKIKSESETPLFSRGGVHWNQFGSSHISSEILKQSKSLMDIFIPEIESISIDDKPSKAEHDLARLMNLIKPLVSEVPHLKFSSVTANRDYYKPRILIVGDSFSHEIEQYLTNNKVYESLEFLYYYRTNISFPSGRQSPIEELNWDEEVLNMKSECG